MEAAAIRVHNNELFPYEFPEGLILPVAGKARSLKD
jgi:hypothetical protein